MVDRRVVIALAALLIVIAGAVTMGSNGNLEPRSAKQFVQLSGSAESGEAPDPPVDDAPKLGASGISHATPPPLDALRDYSHAQSVYDQEAKPGDFVTPPAISIEH